MTTIYPGQEVHYRLTNKTRILVEEAVVNGSSAYTLVGRRITKAGETDRRDTKVPHTVSVHVAQVEKIIDGEFRQFDDDTNMHITHNRPEDAYYVWYGDGCVGAYETLSDAWDEIVEAGL